MTLSFLSQWELNQTPDEIEDIERMKTEKMTLDVNETNKILLVNIYV